MQIDLTASPCESRTYNLHDGAIVAATTSTKFAHLALPLSQEQLKSLKQYGEQLSAANKELLKLTNLLKLEENLINKDSVQKAIARVEQEKRQIIYLLNSLVVQITQNEMLSLSEQIQKELHAS